MVKRNAATARGDHSPAIVLTIASPTDSELKPAAASKMPLRSLCCTLPAKSFCNAVHCALRAKRRMFPAAYRFARWTGTAGSIGDRSGT